MWQQGKTESSLPFMVCKSCEHTINYWSDALKNPTFSHPEEVLEVMMKRDDWSFGFSEEIGCWYMVNHESRWFHIRYDYITEKDKLLQAAVDFLQQKKCTKY
jgi:hypothetical protein